MNRPPKHFYQFDSFRVDVIERQLLRDGQEIPLTAKVFDILLLLVENSGQTIEKNDLMQKIWADTFVEEGNLNRNISTLRKVLGDDGHRQRFIKTVPKRGYRFTAQVQEILEDTQSLVVENRRRFHLTLKEEIKQEEKISSRWNFQRVWVILALGLIATGIAFFLSGERKEEKVLGSLIKGGTNNPEAFQDFQQGRTLWQTRNAEDLHRATLLLEQALKKDPNFALAHAALADAYAFDYTNWKKAESEAQEAIRLEPELGEPHATLGFIRMFWQWKLFEAEEEFKQAIALSPNYATAHQWYAINLNATGHGQAALAELNQALQLEPNSLSINADICQTLYFLHRYDQAQRQCEETLKMDPTFIQASFYLGNIYEVRGMEEDFIKNYFKIEELTGINSPEVLEKLRQAYQKGGLRGFQLATLELVLRPKQSYYQQAQVYARLGETENSIRLLKTAFAQRDFDCLFLLADPAFENLRADPRFLELGNLFLEGKPEEAV